MYSNVHATTRFHEALHQHRAGFHHREFGVEEKVFRDPFNLAFV